MAAANPQLRTAAPGSLFPPVVAQPFTHVVNAIVTEIPLRLEPVTEEDAFEVVNDLQRETVRARIAELFGTDEPRRAIVD